MLIMWHFMFMDECDVIGSLMALVPLMHSLMLCANLSNLLVSEIGRLHRLWGQKWWMTALAKNWCEISVVDIECELCKTYLCGAYWCAPSEVLEVLAPSEILRCVCGERLQSVQCGFGWFEVFL
jgi:hypothetical protein